ncbi:MAG: hypothetical protein AMXMBFR81_02900 [Chthonomonas sp.]
MDAIGHLVAGLAFVALGLAAAALQVWLWRFPMVPDPSGRDPHGVSTAPRSWTNVHRGLGYVFLLVLIAMLVPMVPRLWTYDEDGWTGAAILHAALGGLILMVVAAKIAIIRRFQRWGHLLPWLGGTLVLASLILVGSAAVPVQSVMAGATPEVRSVLATGCIRCHGLSTVARGAEDHGWGETLAKMRKKAAKRNQGDPTRGLSGALEAHLQRVLPSEAHHDRESEVEESEGEEDDD